MKQPIILFENYMLRDINIHDAKDMFEYGSDMEVVKKLSWGPYLDITEAAHSINKFFLARPHKGLPVGYSIIDLTNHKMIGTVDLHTKLDDNVYELGYVLNRKYWNKGIMTKAVRKLLEVAFYYHGATKIIVGHVSDNLASQKVITNNNFKFTHEESEKTYDRFTGTKVPAKWYELTKENFK